MDLHTYDGWVPYTPKALGNRDLPEPFSLEIRVMTGAEWKRHKLAEAGRMTDPENGLRNAEEIISREITGRVRNIKNLRKVVHTHNGEEAVDITDPKEFDELAPDDLRSEIYQFLINTSRLGDEVKKK